MAEVVDAVLESLTGCAGLARGVIGEEAVDVSDGLELAVQVLVNGGDSAVADQEAAGGRCVLLHVLECCTHVLRNDVFRLDATAFLGAGPIVALGYAPTIRHFLPEKTYLTITSNLGEIEGSKLAHR